MSNKRSNRSGAASVACNTLGGLDSSPSQAFFLPVWNTYDAVWDARAEAFRGAEGMPGITVGLLEDEVLQAELMLAWLADAGYQAFHRDTGHSFVQAVQHAL